jgi:hypothetical protein
MAVMWLVLPLDGKWWYSTANHDALMQVRSDILRLIFRDPEGSDSPAAAEMLQRRPVSADVGSWQCLFCNFFLSVSTELEGKHDADCMSPIIFTFAPAALISSQATSREPELIATVSSRTYNEDRLRAGLSASYKNAVIAELGERVSAAESLSEETAQELAELRVANETRDQRLSALEEENVKLSHKLEVFLMANFSREQVRSLLILFVPHSLSFFSLSISCFNGFPAVVAACVLSRV